MFRLLLLIGVVLISACSDSSPTSPTPPTPPPVTMYTLTGIISSAAGGGIAGASVTVVDGVNAGKAGVTDGSGRYTIAGLSFAGFSVNIVAPDHVGVGRSAPLTAGTPSTTLNVTLLPATLWSQTGAGNTVFNMPTYVTRVRITGVWNRTQTSNFIVRVGGSVEVNEILRDSITYTGIHLVTGGVVEITNSAQIAWTFVEQR